MKSAPSIPVSAIPTALIPWLVPQITGHSLYERDIIDTSSWADGPFGGSSLHMQHDRVESWFVETPFGSANIYTAQQSEVYAGSYYGPGYSSSYYHAESTMIVNEQHIDYLLGWDMFGFGKG